MTLPLWAPKTIPVTKSIIPFSIPPLNPDKFFAKSYLFFISPCSSMKHEAELCTWRRTCVCVCMLRERGGGRRVRNGDKWRMWDGRKRSIIENNLHCPYLIFLNLNVELHQRSIETRIRFHHRSSQQMKNKNITSALDNLLKNVYNTRETTFIPPSMKNVQYQPPF